VTPAGDTALLQLDNKLPFTSCAHFAGNGSDDAALAWHGNTLYFANPSMSRVCALEPSGKVETIVGVFHIP
jgi:hypothetical protein